MDARPCAPLERFIPDQWALGVAATAGSGLQGSRAPSAMSDENSSSRSLVSVRSKRLWANRVPSRATPNSSMTCAFSRSANRSAWNAAGSRSRRAKTTLPKTIQRPLPSGKIRSARHGSRHVWPPSIFMSIQPPRTPRPCIEVPKTSISITLPIRPFSRAWCKRNSRNGCLFEEGGRQDESYWLLPGS